MARPLSASFICLGASPLHAPKAFKTLAEGWPLSPSCSYRTVVVEYRSDLGISIHQPISESRGKAHTDWSDGLWLHPQELGDQQKKNQAVVTRGRGVRMSGRPTQWISTGPFDFNCAIYSENLTPGGVSMLRSELLAALGLILLTASARLPLRPCSHDTPAFPTEVEVNGLLQATIRGIL